MARPQQRESIGPGIYRKGDKIIAEVRVGSSRDGKQRRQRKVFRIDESEALTTRRAIAWALHKRGDLLDAAPVAIVRDSLASDVETFVSKLPAGTYRDDSRGILAHWATSPHGAKPRHALARLDVIAQIAEWRDKGAATGTLNRRLSRLRKVFHMLDVPIDGLPPSNPTDGTKFEPEPEREAREIPHHIVKLILDLMPDVGRASKAGETRPTTSETKIRLRVMAWTGIQGATLRRITPRQLELDNARVYLERRRKGKQKSTVTGAWVALLPQAVEAFRAFADAKLFHKRWARGSMHKAWRRAIARATKAATRYAERTGDASWATALAHLPPRCKPYDLRHSFASEMYRQTGDIRAVAELLQHRDFETTKRYTQGAVSDRVVAAIAKAQAVYDAAPSLPALPPANATKPLRLVRKGA